ncbi:hypothetical protein J6Q66_02690 [bacterium]|nr:hypothetical protein [bacterium]
MFDVQTLRTKLLKKKLSARDVKTFYRLYKSLQIVYPYGFCNFEYGKPNYEAKAIIFEFYANDLKKIDKYRRFQYLKDSGKLLEFWSSLTYYQQTEWIALVNEVENLRFYSPCLFKECCKILNANQHRKRRLKNRIENISSTGLGYFVTFTFTDSFFDNTDSFTRRRYVSRFLKSISSNYVANIDFGKKNEREHYHAVVQIEKLTNCEFFYHKKYGYISYSADEFSEVSRWGYYSIRKIKVTDKDFVKLAKYVSKLSNHAVKETTKRNALIYSR